MTGIESQVRHYRLISEVSSLFHWGVSRIELIEGFLQILGADFGFDFGLSGTRDNERSGTRDSGLSEARTTELLIYSHSRMRWDPSELNTDDILAFHRSQSLPFLRPQERRIDLREQAVSLLEVSFEIPSRTPGVRGPLVAFYKLAPTHSVAADFELISTCASRVGQALDQIELREQTERQRVQLLAHSKMAILGEMAGGIAHEINNPLFVINGKLSHLEKQLQQIQPPLGKINEDLQKILTMTARIAKIVSGLRQFSRNGEQDPKTATSLLEILNDTLELCQERLNNAHIELRLQIPPDLKVFCRAVQISQVLMNLLSNSFDAIESRAQKWIAISALRTDLAVEITVMDSGPGIDPLIAPRIMQPFFTTKEIGKGTGLGLSISKGLIESHGGSLVYNAQSLNTAFTFTLPNAENI